MTLDEFVFKLASLSDAAEPHLEVKVHDARGIKNRPVVDVKMDDVKLVDYKDDPTFHREIVIYV